MFNSLRVTSDGGEPWPVVEGGGWWPAALPAPADHGWWDDVLAAEEVALAGAYGDGAGPGPLPGDDRVGGRWPELGGEAPGVELAGRLVGLGVAGLDEYDLVEAVAAWERLAGFAQAQQVAAVAELARRPLFARLSSGRDGVDPVRGVALEISARLRVSAREAERRVDLARVLSGPRSATLAALLDGRIDYWRARTLVDGLAVLDDEPTAAEVEARLLQAAPELARATLRHRVAKAVAAADPAGAERRHQRALADRVVACRPEPDGMGSVWALLAAPDAMLLDRLLDAAADGLRQANPDDDRTHAQRRADALAAMARAAWSWGWIGACPTCAGCPSDRRALPDGPKVQAPMTASETEEDDDRGRHRNGDGHGATVPPTGAALPGATTRTAPDVSREGIGPAAGIRLRGRGGRLEIGVLVPFSTLIGIDEQPAELIGYGPIPASVARRLAADGTWRRILTDPATGMVLDYGTGRYPPPPELAAHVMLRDQTCRGVGCTRPAAGCDLDHIEPAPRGPTSAGNLCPLCRLHHNGKTHCGWRLAHARPGLLRWRSPTGHHYERGPEQVGPIIQTDHERTDQPAEEPPPF